MGFGVKQHWVSSEAQPFEKNMHGGWVWGGSIKGFPNLNVGRVSCSVSRVESSRLTKHSPSLALKQTRKSVRVFLFVYPVFLVESCSFMIEFNGSFVFSQEKSMAGINKNNPCEKLTPRHHCMLNRYSCNLRARRTTVRQGGLTFPSSIKRDVLVITGLQCGCIFLSSVCLS